MISSYGGLKSSGVSILRVQWKVTQIDVFTGAHKVWVPLLMDCQPETEGSDLQKFKTFITHKSKPQKPTPKKSIKWEAFCKNQMQAFQAWTLK